MESAARAWAKCERVVWAMRLVDLTHSTSRRAPAEDVVPVVVRSADPIHRVPLDGLVTLATVIDLTGRAEPGRITRSDVAKVGVAGISGCILRTDWSDKYLSGMKQPVPELSVDAAAYLLEGGVRTVAADFPMTSDAADLLIHNHCVLVYCLSNIAALGETIVRLVALPLKLEDTYSAEARVVAMEE